MSKLTSIEGNTLTIGVYPSRLSFEDFRELCTVFVEHSPPTSPLNDWACKFALAEIARREDSCSRSPELPRFDLGRLTLDQTADVLIEIDTLRRIVTRPRVVEFMSELQTAATLDAARLIREYGIVRAQEQKTNG
ncbi:MAG: hypothetical protein QM770_07950 [Tepidisphaeraceae bacterium]